MKAVGFYAFSVGFYILIKVTSLYGANNNILSLRNLKSINSLTQFSPNMFLLIWKLPWR